MAAICGADCGSCGMRERCRGCAETEGYPFGDECVVYKCYKGGGEKSFYQYKNQLIEEFTFWIFRKCPRSLSYSR